MATDRPDPGEFIEMAQRMMRQLFGDNRSDEEPWASTADPRQESSQSRKSGREPSPQEQRENLTFALATRAVEALEDVALNVAAIRQRLERLDTQGSGVVPPSEGPGPDGADSAGQ
jgi:hypothetical protein